MFPSILKDISGVYRVPDLEEMASLAGRVASQLQAGDILLLFGDLGSGKTAFVQSLAVTLGVESRVTSPTFTVAAEYDIPSSHIAHQLVHVDLYRLGASGGGSAQIPSEDMEHVRDMFDTARQLKRIIVVEWAERLGNRIPGGAWVLRFSHGEKRDERVVKISRR